MSGFKNISIKNKLIIIQVITAFIAVLICCGFFLYNDIKAIWSSAFKTTNSIAEIIGVNLISPIVFNDKDAATKILMNLKTNPSILNAAVFDKSGNKFAGYENDGGEVFTFPLSADKNDGALNLSNRKYIVTYDIYQEKEYMGKLMVRAELSDLNDILYNYIVGTVLVLFIGILTAIVISIFLQRTISNRVLSLVSKTREVTETGNYSIRVPSTGNDEIGKLAAEFNTMLQTTEKSERDLKEVNINLEKRVKDRTAELEDSEKKFRKLIQLAPDGVITIDEEGMITGWNQQAELLFQWKADEITGRRLTDTIIPEKYRDNIIYDLQHYLLTGKGPVLKESEELSAKRKDGSEFPVELKISAFKINENYTFIGFIRDITSRKQAEEEIKKKSDDLMHSNQELEQFAYVASHDLQEPLRTIANYVELIDESYPGEKDKDYNEYFSFVTAATARMQNLIKDLLEFSRVGRNPKFVDVDCNKLLKDILAEMDTSIKESRAKISVSQLPILKGVEVELKRLFQNLISNALKFRKKDVIPEISISAEEKETEYLFSIKDNGIGIDEKLVPKLFIIFQRLHSVDEYPGTGIGLVTTKKIVQLHGGKIWIESKPGHGSNFYFTIRK